MSHPLWPEMWVQLFSHGWRIQSRKRVPRGDEARITWHITAKDVGAGTHLDVDGYEVYDRQQKGHKLAWAQLDSRLFPGDILSLPTPTVGR